MCSARSEVDLSYMQLTSHLSYITLLAGLGLSSLAGAEDADTAKPTLARAMGQGEASIQVRSDVELAVKGTGGTPKQRVDALAAAIRGELAQVRACYRERVQVDPKVTGAYRVGLRLGEGRKPELSVEERAGSDGILRQCVEGTLNQADYAAVERPAEATVTLRFNNSRASGQQSLDQTVAGTSFVIERTPAGETRGGWSDPSERVTFTVTGSDPGVVNGALRALRDNYAAFLDCRRRAERGGLSPAGVLSLELRGKAGGALQPHVRGSSVASRQTPQCVVRAVQGTQCPACAQGRLSMELTLGP